MERPIGSTAHRPSNERALPRAVIPPTDWSHVHQTTATRSHLPELRGHFYSKHLVARLFISSLILSLSRVSSLSLYLPRSHIHPEILSDFGPIAPPARGRPAIESSGDRTQVSISSSALASLDPHDFDQVFLIFLPFLFIEVIDTEHLKSRTAGGVLESQILGR